MVESVSRRAVLQLTGVAGGVALAGCSSLSAEPPMVNLVVVNHAESPYTVDLDIFRSSDDTSRSDARVYGTSIDVAPDGEARRETIAKADSYLVRYSAYENNQRQTDEDHVHYYPTDEGTTESLIFDISTAGVVTRR